MNSKTQDWAVQNTLEVASAIVDGQLGIIEGCRRLSSLGHDVVSDTRTDDDFRAFLAVDSETDSLPAGSARQYWEAAALAREDERIREAEHMYRDAVITACSNIIKRFKDPE